MTVLLAAAAAALFSLTLDAKQPRAASTPCGEEASLRPRDEAPRRRDFVEFRRRLQDAVRRKDTEAVLSMLDRNVRVDFGGGGGIEDFKTRMNDPQANFWEEFATVLALGGTFAMPTEPGALPTQFRAPYIYSAWPEQFDPFECVAVTGTRVRLREAPRLNARTLALLDFAIVQWFREPDIPAWKRVRLAGGRTGYIASRYLRSSVDYRAIFDFKGGRWWLMAFVAGD